MVDTQKTIESLSEDLMSLKAEFERLGPRPPWWRRKSRRWWDVRSGILHASLALHRVLADRLVHEASAKVLERIKELVNKKADRSKP